MGSSSVWGDIWGFTVTEYVWSRDLGIFRRWWAKVVFPYTEPKKVKDIQSFLGFANFYRHYIHNYSNIVVPLTRLTQKDTPWDNVIFLSPFSKMLS